MIKRDELERIESKFKRLIDEEKIMRPKPGKVDFFRKKAQGSLQLAGELLEKRRYFDWIVNISYYSMFYNAVSLLAYKNVDVQEIDEGVHMITYQALVFYFFIKSNKIEEQFLEDFKKSMQESDVRLRNLARRKTEDMLGSYKNAKEDRGKVTYELGQIAEENSAKIAFERARNFDILVEKLMM